MTLRTRILEALHALGLKRQDLAASLRTSPAAVTRLLARPDEDQTIGQLRAVADALNLHWHHALSDPGEQYRQFQEVARGVDPCPGEPVFSGGLTKTLQAAVESQLQHAMRQQYEPQTFVLPLRTGEPWQVVGWHLGQTPFDPAQPGELDDVYWVIYTSRHWASPFGAGLNNLVLHRGEFGSAFFVDHVRQRAPVKFPNAQGRAYRSLSPYTLMERLTYGAGLLIEREPGTEEKLHLVLLDVRPSTHVHEEVAGAVRAAERVLERRETAVGDLATRITQVQEAYGVSAAWRDHDLYMLGFTTLPGLDAAENLQAVEDATDAARRAFARQYRVSPRWIEDGTGRPVLGSTLRSGGWYGEEIVEQLTRSALAGQLQGVLLLFDGPGAGASCGVQLAWQLAHPQVPGASVYEAVSWLDWGFSPQRVRIKAVVQFVQAAGWPLFGLSVPEAAQRSPDGEVRLFPDVIRHPVVRPLELDAVLSAHGGWSEVEASGHPQPRDVAYFFADFGAPAALEQIRGQTQA